MEWDIELYDAETNQPCIVNTSDLNEELGQVSNVLSCYVMDNETFTDYKNVGTVQIDEVKLMKLMF